MVKDIELQKIGEVELPNLFMDEVPDETYAIAVTSYGDGCPALVLCDIECTEVIDTLSVNLSGYGAMPPVGYVFIQHDRFGSETYKKVKEIIGLQAAPLAYGPFSAKSEILEVKGLKEILDKLYESE